MCFSKIRISKSMLMLEALAKFFRNLVILAGVLHVGDQNIPFHWIKAA